MFWFRQNETIYFCSNRIDHLIEVGIREQSTNANYNLKQIYKNPRKHSHISNCPIRAVENFSKLKAVGNYTETPNREKSNIKRKNKTLGKRIKLAKLE